MFIDERLVLAWCIPTGAGSLGISMTNYTLIKVGNDYVVRADDQCILKVGSRRRAAQLIGEARVLLDALVAAQSRDEASEDPSLHHETPEAP
jgi:hypothetical protein